MDQILKNGHCRFRPLPRRDHDLFEASLDIARTVAEHIRRATETAQILENHPVRCTIGLTQLRKEDTVKTLFGRADTFLYRGKQSGRNRVVTDNDDSGA